MRRAVLMVLGCCLIVSVVGAQEYVDPQQGTNPKTATAYQIPPITVDGDLSDWPEGLEKRVCNEFYPSGYQVTSPANKTEENYFMVAWNEEENQIYVAGWSHDDVAVFKRSEWWNADFSDMAARSWFVDRWEIYFEWDNTDEGAHGDDGTVQYVIARNDPENDGVLGHEMDNSGNPLEDGTAFWINQKADLTADGRPWRSSAELVVIPDDSDDPFGPHVKRFEAAITGWTFYDGDGNTDADALDLGPDVNGGDGIGFDVTMMDRDGYERGTEDQYTEDDQGAWIGWSSESKNSAPEALGTLFFNMDFASTEVRDWSLH